MSTATAGTTRPQVSASLRAAVLPWTVSHLATWVVAIVVGSLVDYRPVARVDVSVPQALRLIGAWDGFWYMDVARHGYLDTATGPEGYSNMAFFPLYPMAIRLGMGLGLPPFWSALVVSAAAAFCALVVFHLLTATLFDAERARRATWVLALLPIATTFALTYSEGLAVMLAAGAALLAVRGRFAWAGVTAAVATLNRPTGVLAALLVAGLALCGSDAVGARIRRALWGIVPAITAFGGLLVWMQLAHGDWQLPFRAQHAWHRGVGTPFVHDFQQPTRIDELVRDLLVGAVAVLLIVTLARRRGGGPAGPRWPWWGYSTACIVLPLTTGSVYSLARFSLLAFPLVWPATDWVTASSRRRTGALAAAVVLGVAFVAQWAWHSP